MTQTLIEQLEALPRYDAEIIENSEGAQILMVGMEKGEFVDADDLRAIIDQHKSQPDIIAELVKALKDDAYAASFQSMAGYRTALIAKVKGVMG